MNAVMNFLSKTASVLMEQLDLLWNRVSVRSTDVSFIKPEQSRVGELILSETSRVLFKKLKPCRYMRKLMLFVVLVILMALLHMLVALIALANLVALARALIA